MTRKEDKIELKKHAIKAIELVVSTYINRSTQEMTTTYWALASTLAVAGFATNNIKQVMEIIKKGTPCYLSCFLSILMAIMLLVLIAIFCLINKNITSKMVSATFPQADKNILNKTDWNTYLDGEIKILNKFREGIEDLCIIRSKNNKMIFTFFFIFIALVIIITIISNIQNA